MPLIFILSFEQPFNNILCHTPLYNLLNMSTLPHANSRPLFQYRNAGGARIALRGTKPYPREIDDYVIDSSKFPARYNTVNKVLKARPGCALKCEACDEKVAQCDGQNCIVSTKWFVSLLMFLFPLILPPPV